MPKSIGTQHLPFSDEVHVRRSEQLGKDKISISEQHLPHALQMLLPASSRRQRGVVLVPQLAQLSAPTAPRPRGVLTPLAPASAFFTSCCGFPWPSPWVPDAPLKSKEDEAA